MCQKCQGLGLAVVVSMPLAAWLWRAAEGVGAGTSISPEVFRFQQHLGPAQTWPGQSLDKSWGWGSGR